MLSFETALLSQMCLEFPPVIGRIEYLNLSPANPMCAYMYPPSHSDRCSRPAVYATQNNARLMTHYYTSTRAIIHGSLLIITRPPGKLYTACDPNITRPPGNLYTARNLLLHVHQGKFTHLATPYYTSTRVFFHGLQLITTRPLRKSYMEHDFFLPVWCSFFYIPHSFSVV